MNSRLRVWQSSLALVAGGVLAQLAGVALVIVVAVAQGALDESAFTTVARNGVVLLLAGAVIQLVLIAVAAATVLLGRVPLPRGLALRRVPLAVAAVGAVGVLGLGPVCDLFHRAIIAIAPGLSLGALDTLSAGIQSVPPALAVVTIGIMPGLGEELFFRGMFQGSVARPWLAVVLSAVLFCAYHLDPHQAFAILPVGFYLAWMRQQTGSVVPSALAHMLNNSLAVGLLVSGVEGEAAPTANTPMWLAGPGLLFTAAAMALVWHRTRRPATSPPEGPAPSLP